MNEVIYTPRSDLQDPWKFVLGLFRDLAACRGLAWRLFQRDFTARYRQSLLGYAWALIPPLATTATFVFLRSQGLFTTDATAIPYAAYVFIGMLFWQVFVESLQCPLRAMTAAKPLLAKVNFPPEAVVVAALGDVVFTLLVRLVLLVGVFLWFRILPPPTILLAPLAVLALMLLGLTLGITITPVGLLYNDVAQSLTVVSSFWLFLTPVIYPARDAGLAALLSRWNPVSPLVIVGRDWTAVGSTTHLFEFVVVVTLSVVVLLAGWICFRIAMPHLIARIGN